jgi:hypothetical protein
VAKKEMIKSRLPNPVLAKVWRLADVDGDGMLDSDEFALAMHLINIKLEGYDLPEDLPGHLVRYFPLLLPLLQPPFQLIFLVHRLVDQNELITS